MLEVDLEVRQRDVIFSMVHNIYKTRPTSSMSINTSLYFSSSNFSCIFSLTSKISTLSDHHPLLHVQLVNPNRHQVAHELRWCFTVVWWSVSSYCSVLNVCLLWVTSSFFSMFSRLPRYSLPNYRCCFFSGSSNKSFTLKSNKDLVCQKS